jgi:hypothetical protein
VHLGRQASKNEINKSKPWSPIGTVEKSGQKFCATYVLKKLTIGSNRLTGENSPNLVTLVVTNLSYQTTTKFGVGIEFLSN